MYQNKTIYVATKHEKERVIKPIFESILGCEINVVEDFDTDIFGTFSGDIKRKASAYETCIAKAKSAAQKFNLDYVIASEGSFGPHPTLFFVPSDIEILVFLDIHKNIIIDEYFISTETNYSYLDIYKNCDYHYFLKQIRFPSHKVIIKDLDSNLIIEKGLDNLRYLDKLIKKYQNNNTNIRIETDMRAMCNPTRMLNIEKLSIQLANRITQQCPNCNYPGFGRVELRGHLPCEDCGFESNIYKNKVLTCIHCDYKIDKERDDGMKYSKSQYCSICNP